MRSKISDLIAVARPGGCVALSGMRFTLVFILAAAWCVLSVFVIRHHRRKSNSFQKTTLGGIYLDFLQAMPMLLKPRNQLFFLLGMAAVSSSFFPVLLIGGVRAGGGQGLFLIGGLVALVGAGVNIVLIVLSHADFMGGSSACKEETVLTWLLPLSQAIVAVTSAAVGISGGWVSAVCGFILH
jgi:hypothetical protein